MIGAHVEREEGGFADCDGPVSARSSFSGKPNALLVKLTHGTPAERKDACVSLGSTESYDPDVLRTLLKALSDRSPKVQAAALESISQITERWGVQAELLGLLSESREPLIRLSEHDEEPIRSCAVRMLMSLPDLHTALIMTFLQDSDPSVRGAVIAHIDPHLPRLSPHNREILSRELGKELASADSGLKTQSQRLLTKLSK